MRSLLILVVALTVAFAGTALAMDRFSDVSDSDPFHDEIAWLVDNGITDGYDDGTFRPNEVVKRQALAAFLERLDSQDVFTTFAEVEAMGVEGPRGPQGPTGATGEQGPAGPQGDTGPQGETGPQGLAGLKGDKGDQGDIGLQGPQGDTGPQGPEGPEGPQGPQGDTGPQGPAGADGAGGVSGYEIVTGTYYFTAATPRRAQQASCPRGKVVLGGGYSVSVDDSATIHIMRPYDDRNRDLSYYTVEYTPTADASITVYAICASTP